MGPLLVVEDERRGARSSQLDRTARDLGVSFRQVHRGRAAGIDGAAGESRHRIAQGLTHVQEGLVVHVLVEHGELVEVGLGFPELSLAEPGQDAVPHRVHIVQGLLARR